MRKASSIQFINTTFIILVKDNVNYSKKLISHINSQNIKAEFIIADGSRKNQKSLFSNLKQKKNYIYFSEDKNLIKFFKKVYKSISYSKRDLIFFCDQDDLVNFNVLKKKEVFLNNNKKFSAAKGILYSFEYFNKDKIKILGKTYRNYDDSNYFFLRHLFNPIFRSYYCLHRKKNLKKIFQLIVDKKINDFRSAEFIMDFITLSSGKIKFFNETSVLRWSGIKNKKNKHILNEMHSNRLKWYKYFFSNHQDLIKSVLQNENFLIKNFDLFKIYIFFIDILTNEFFKILSKFNNFLKKS